MSELTKFLSARLSQLEHRKMMIPRYVKNPGSFLGKKDFSLDQLPKIEEDIQETKAAIRGIETWKDNLKNEKKKCTSVTK
jgi:hypothetical protein